MWRMAELHRIVAWALDLTIHGGMCERRGGGCGHLGPKMVLGKPEAEQLLQQRGAVLLCQSTSCQGGGAVSRRFEW